MLTWQLSAGTHRSVWGLRYPGKNRARLKLKGNPAPANNKPCRSDPSVRLQRKVNIQHCRMCSWQSPLARRNDAYQIPTNGAGAAEHRQQALRFHSFFPPGGLETPTPLCSSPQHKGPITDQQQQTDFLPVFISSSSFHA